MTIRGFVVKWDDLWRYDFWWRQKHNAAFNSKKHREISQIDIVFEYVENHLLNEAIEMYKDDEKRRKRFLTEGWMSESVVNKEKVEEAFKKLDLSKL